MQIKLSGPSALVAAFALLAFGAYRFVAMQTELETEALDELANYLAAEYASEDVAALSESLDSGRPVTAAEAQSASERILAASNIRFPSVSARGMWNARDGGKVVARVEILVNETTPPDGESVRYYRLRYRPLSGWDVLGRTTVWSYRLALF